MIIGLDIGIASLGWGIIDTKKDQIIDAGVRIFSKAETAKTGASLAEPRRLARGARRRIRRRIHRLERIKTLFIDSALINKSQLDSLFSTKKNCLTPWQLRYDGLSRILDPEELARALYHIARKRGFKSNRKSELQDKDIGKLLSGVSANSDLLKHKNYRTVGEMFFLDPKFSDKKRNSRNSYLHTVSRDLLVDEINIIFSIQRNLGNPHATKLLQDKFIEIFSSQRSYDDGDLINKMRGFCTFEKDQKRAPKFSYSAERFVLLSKLVNLTFSEPGKQRQHIGITDYQLLINLAYTTSKITYKQLRKKLNLSDTVKFTGLNYNQAEKQGKNIEAQTFMELKGFHELRKVIEQNCDETDWGNLVGNHELLDNIAEILTCWKSDDNRQQKLSKLDLSSTVIDALLSISSFNQFVNLSQTAINKILPLMESGSRYDEAASEVYGDFRDIFSGSKEKLLPCIPKDDIRNPVVFRALTQTRKVLNAIIREYDSSDRIHIELARDLSKSSKDRKQIEKSQKEFRNNKKQACNQFFELYKQQPGGHDLLKFRLHKEQSGRCPYSGKPIETGRLIELGYVDIDHIIPWSRSFDDSMNNKVLCLSYENRQKGNKTPFEYIANSDPLNSKWMHFKAEISHYRQTKRWRLLKENYDEKAEQEFRERNANDTRYISRYLRNFIAEHLLFQGDDKQPVQSSNGVLTNYLRVRWGLLKDRDESDLHHAIDALLVAGITRSMIKQLSDASKRNELWASDAKGKDAEELIDQSTGEIIQTVYQKNRKLRLPQPWEDYSHQVNEYVENHIFVSRMPQRKLTGAAHQETIRSTKYMKDNIAVTKTPLTSLNLSKLEDMFAKERNNRLYLALKERLNQFTGKGDKAFVEPFFMPTNNKEVQGPPVHSIKLVKTMYNGVSVNQGIASHETMVRTDVFSKDGKYFLVPLYVADMVKKTLPNHAIVAKKPKQDWVKMDNSYQFCFSLFRYDLIEIKHKKKGILLGYYTGCHSGTGAISIIRPDRSLPIKPNSWINEKKLLTMRKKGEKEIQGIGVKTGMEYFHKYEVDLLGNYFQVKSSGDRNGLA